MTANATRIFAALRAPRAPLLRVGALAVMAAMLAPSAAVIFGAFLGGGGLSAAAAADYALQTALYAGCTLVFAAAIALPAAWLTVMRSFRGCGAVS
ncbi:MAG: hypothetical protein HAW59_03480, partial [Betaproteobacteria bacterium]|nr:hypothetical protein [Betaproteobacteria bacterium]